MRGRCRSRGSDLTLAARPGWTHSVALKVSVFLWFVYYAITTSRKGVLVRHMACRVTTSFRASATLALRGPVLSAIALAQSRRRGPPRFRQKIVESILAKIEAEMEREGLPLEPLAERLPASFEDFREEVPEGFCFEEPADWTSSLPHYRVLLTRLLALVRHEGVLICSWSA